MHRHSKKEFVAGLTHIVELDKGADHAGAQSALLAWWDIEGHVCKCRQTRSIRM